MNAKQAAQVIDLLEFFAVHQKPASLAEIARHFGWPRSSTFNLLGSLANRGYLFEPRAKAGYYPAPAWATLIRAIEAGQPGPPGIRDLLETLVSDTGETAVLAAASGSHALFVETVESPRPVRYAAHVGKRVPLHATATGRALLAQMSAEDRAAHLARVVYERHTTASLMSAAEVEAEIERSRLRGWFVGNAGFTQDLGGVALAFAWGERHYALLVAGPSYRVDDRLAELAAVLERRLRDYLAGPSLAGRGSAPGGAARGSRAGRGTSA